MDKIVEMRNISKEFSGVAALRNINFDLMTGEVHVVLGENGAGKSTLMKILSGAYVPTSGEIIIGGARHSSLTPASSEKAGISIIYQELSVVNELSIAENLFMGRLPECRKFGMSFIDEKALRAKSLEAIEQVGLRRDPDEIVRDLSISEKQLVEIAKALTLQSRVIIMDEPTSSLTIEETKKLFTLIRSLKERSVGIVYISHKLDEIAQIGDRVTVLKDGQYVGTRMVADITTDDMVTMMVGRELNRQTRLKHTRTWENPATIFSVSHLTRKDGRVRDVSFGLKQGEILGFAGLIGSGRTELMETIFGVVPRKQGTIELNGKVLDHRSTYGALKNRIALVTENRRETGFFGNFSILDNLAITSSLLTSKMGGMWGLVNARKDQELAEDMRKALNIKCASINQYITELSGGNQQKVLIGKWLASDPSVLIFDEPTKGIDVGSKAEIYQTLRQLADMGKGVIIVSSELPELLFICDRIAVFGDGRITAELSAESATEESIMRAATHSASS